MVCLDRQIRKDPQRPSVRRGGVLAGVLADPCTFSLKPVRIDVFRVEPIRGDMGTW